MTAQPREQIHGLRDVRQYKLYQRGHTYFVSHQDAEKQRRLQLPNRAAAEAFMKMTESDFVMQANNQLDAAQRLNSHCYFEQKHRRVA